MNLQPVLLSLLLAAAGASHGAAVAAAGVETADVPSAGERCEAAVAETVKHMRGDDARQVQFTRAQRSVLPPVDEETEVKGEGTYRGNGPARGFSYSCAYNVKAGTTSGIVFRDHGAAQAQASAEKAWQPDLATLSPEACEAAVAQVLKGKFPRVGRIAFGSDSRKLRPAANANTGLEGQGSVERAPGMNLVPFDYRCEFEPRSGKLVSARTNL